MSSSSSSSPIALVVHGHFYQPPRENPWSDAVEREPSASPFHDWNARIDAECYAANAFARIVDGKGRIEDIVNNYARMSFNFGPTLGRWLARHDARTHARLVAADRAQAARLGAGGAMAQVYAHPIVPLATPADRRTQILWGLADFQRRFGHPAAGMWLPETAANPATLAALLDAGVAYTIVAPEQVAAVRAPGGELVAVDKDSVDTGRTYRWLHPDGSGRALAVAVFDGPLSRALAFGEASRDAGALLAAVRGSAARTHVTDAAPLVLCASDGELFGHHRKFADMTLAFFTHVEAARQGIEVTNLGAYLAANPPTWELAIGTGPDGKGTAWSCAHGVGRWMRDCGCSMAPPEWQHAWRTPLREAMDRLQRAAAEFYEEEAAELLVDPWGARDAYGEVVDEPIAERDVALAAFARPALAAGGAEARDRVRLLLEMQRATLLMYASCGWYFDDIAGLEASLVLRLAAHAADLMREAGGAPPEAEFCDILAEGKSNLPGGGTGADVYRRVAGDRITGARAIAEVALGAVATVGADGAAAATGDAGAAAVADGAAAVAAVAAALASTPSGPRPHAAGGGASAAAAAKALTRAHRAARPRARPQPAGFTVEVAHETATLLADGAAVDSGRARARNLRTGAARTLAFEARASAGGDFECRVGDETIRLAALGVESKSALLPEITAWLDRHGEPLAAAREALELAGGILQPPAAGADTAEDALVRRTLARLLVRVLEAPEATLASEGAPEIAIGLVDAAGAALAPGSARRRQVEDLLAERLHAAPAARAHLHRLAARLGFAVDDEPPAAPRAPRGRRAGQEDRGETRGETRAETRTQAGTQAGTGERTG